MIDYRLADHSGAAGHGRWLGGFPQFTSDLTWFLLFVYPKGAAQNLIVDGFVRRAVEFVIERTSADGAVVWAWGGEGVEHVHSRCGCRRPGLAECRFFDIGRVVGALSDF